MEDGSHRAGVFVISMAGMLSLWIIAAWIGADPNTLPSPTQVLTIAWDEAQSGELFSHVAVTLRRVIFAFAIAMLAGTVTGIMLGMSARLNTWADPWVVVALNLPALVVIVLCYIWIGLNEVAAIVAVSFNKAALVTVTVREGARSLDPKIAEMAHVYRLSFSRRLRHVVLPQLAPYLAASARNGLAIIWKLILVVEFLGRPNGVGFQIHFYFQQFDVGHVLAYALTFVTLMLIVDYALIQRAERNASSWRSV